MQDTIFASLTLRGEGSGEHVSSSFRKCRDAKKKINLFTLIIKM